MQSRSKELLRQLDPHLVKDKLESLLMGLDGEGEEQKFYERWGYDPEQKLEIQQVLVSVAQ